MSFDEIVAKHNIAHSHTYYYFRYLQLRDFIRTQQKQSLSMPNLSILEEMIVKDCQWRGLLSKIYKELVGESSETSAKKLESGERTYRRISLSRSGRKSVLKHKYKQ